MDKMYGLLEQYLSEQVALEEQLYSTIDQQLAEVDEKKFADARNLLINTKQVLEQHFEPLNQMLDKLDQEILAERKQLQLSNVTNLNGLHHKKDNGISRMLCETYSSLNIVIMSNALLYTTALALNSEAVAILALNHLQRLTPLIMKLVELLPSVITTELASLSTGIDPLAGETALKNMKLALMKAPK